MFNFVEIKFSWVSIHGNLWSVICLRYNICSAWFLDIRISTCLLMLLLNFYGTCYKMQFWIHPVISKVANQLLTKPNAQVKIWLWKYNQCVNELLTGYLIVDNVWSIVIWGPCQDGCFTLISPTRYGQGIQVLL